MNKIIEIDIFNENNIERKLKSTSINKEYISSENYLEKRTKTFFELQNKIMNLLTHLIN